MKRRKASDWMSACPVGYSRRCLDLFLDIGRHAMDYIRSTLVDSGYERASGVKVYVEPDR